MVVPWSTVEPYHGAPPWPHPNPYPNPRPNPAMEPHRGPTLTLTLTLALNPPWSLTVDLELTSAVRLYYTSYITMHALKAGGMRCGI